LRALRRETGTIPLIGMSEDLVAEGLVASLARPGGNVTGISLLSPELDGKRQELLVEAVSGVRHLVALGEAAATSPRHIEALREAAAARNVRFTFVGVARLADIQAGLRDAKAQGAAAVNVLASALLSVPGSSTAQRVIDAAAELRMPAMFQWPETAEQGGTLGYGARFTEVYRQRARLVVKVLLGARVADLPVEQPTNFELVINLKSAKAIGADISPSLLARADEVIE
jgi:putative ABC transport system substrate-binding protein